jgi:aspartate aminotransferase
MHTTLITAPIVNDTMSSLAGSHILRVAYEVQALIASGVRIANFTIGDFDTTTFRIPAELEQSIIDAYHQGMTNYPQAMGIPELRQAIADYYQHYLGLNYRAENIIVSSGVRPTLYALYMTVVNEGDGVIYGIPSWNTRAYVVLSKAKHFAIPTRRENNFLLTAEEIKPYLAESAIVALCSPSNPTGTMFTAEQLLPICELVLAENKRRAETGQKPLYLLYDMVYWQYATPERPHVHPLALLPELHPYVIYTDGMSKTFGATGIRVGWAAGPPKTMGHISDLIGFIGAWSPKPEQYACAQYLHRFDAQREYLTRARNIAFRRMETVERMIADMQKEGLPIRCIEPQGGLFMSIEVPVLGAKTPDGTSLNDYDSIRKFILHEGKTAFVPFAAFDNPESETWFRASVSSLSDDNVVYGLSELRGALKGLR